MPWTPEARERADQRKRDGTSKQTTATRRRVRGKGRPKAPKVATVTAATTAVEPAPDPSTGAVVEMADGGAPPESFKERIRRQITGGSQTESKPKPNRAASPGSKVDPRDLSRLMLVPLLSLGMLAINDPAYRMTEDEQEALAEPLANILLRRISALRNLSPDVMDAFAIVAVLGMYGRRVKGEYDARNRSQPVEAPPGYGIPPDLNGSSAGYPVARDAAIDSYIGGVPRV